MIPKPQPTEVKRLASQAINLREKEKHLYAGGN